MVKAEELRRLVTDNGLAWTGCFVLHRLLADVVGALDRRMMALEERDALPGINSVARNRELWHNWDWSQGGEEWTYSPEWKRTLVDEVLVPYLGDARKVLEIGPGAGRWSEILQSRVERLILVDIADRCLEICQDRFKAASNVEYFKSDGKSLAFLADASIDFVWSFDAFVHISPRETEGYLAELARTLRPGGRGVIHHPRSARIHGGYRSSMSAKLFLQLLRKHGLTLVRQFDAWGPDGRFDVRLHDDTITAFEK